MKLNPHGLAGGSHAAVLAGVLAIGVLPWLSGCVTNPVTGEQNLGLVSEQQERDLGRKNYGPYRQAQGGDYVADPEVAAYVQRVGRQVARHADRKLPYEFNVINDSTPNAWALPGGKIALNRGLLTELESEAELAAVISHEIVHAAARHTAQSMERGLLFQGALLAAGVALADSDFAQAGMLGAQLGAVAGQQHYSREAEREADHYGIHYMVRAGYDPNAAVELQKTFVRLSEGKEPGWIDGLFASHPPSPERVENNRKLVAKLGNPGGELGRERYRQAMARLIRTKPAYESYDKAREAFDQKHHDKALGLVDKAISIEPKEALFHTLRGEIEQARGRNRKALAAYDKAMKLNPDYYRIPLARGLLRREMGKTALAREDLERSDRLLPTAEGQYGLGMIARSAGNQAQARAHFQAAARSSSDVGRAAQRQLQRLKQPGQQRGSSSALDNPARVVSVGVLLNKHQRLVVRLKNHAGVGLRQVNVVVAERHVGRLRELGSYTAKRRIPPGESINLRTGLGPLDEQALANLVVIVRGARVAR